MVLRLLEQAARLPLAIAVMVGIGARVDQPGAVAAKRVEEFRWSRDTGEADHRQHGEPALVLARRHAGLDHGLALAGEGLDQRRGPATIADRDERSGPRHLLGKRR